MRAVSGRGRPRILLSLLTAALLLAPAPAVAAPGTQTAHLAEVTSLLARLRGSEHSHADGSAHYHAAAGLTVRELAILGLRQGSGPCLGTFEIDGPAGEHRCSHGPDPAPLREATAGAGHGTAAIGEPPAPAGWTTPSKVPCYTTGPFVQVLFIYPSNQTSRYTTYVEHVRRHIAAMDQMYNISAKAVLGTNGQPSIRHVKWAHDASCKPTVLNTAVNPANFPDISAIENELIGNGKMKSNTKYLAYLDMDGCGGGVGDFWGTTTTSSSNPSNQGGTYGQVFGCLDMFAPYWDGGLIGAHELTHTLGAVNPGAPHTTDGHCWDDEAAPGDGADIMCYDDGYPGAFVRPAACPITAPETFDCRKDDYFNPNPPTGNYLKTHWNTASNQFLSGVEPPSYYNIPLATASVTGNGTYIGGIKTVTATTTAPAGRSISRVEFRVNNVVVDEDSTAPYSTDLDSFQYTNLANVKVTATPYDDLDYPGVASSATFTVANPQVHLDSPTEFSLNSPVVTWAARAAGFGGRTVTKVELTDGYGTLLAPADTSAPYGGTVNLSSQFFGSPTTLTLGLRVTDSAGVVRETVERTMTMSESAVYGPYSTDSGTPTNIAGGSHTLRAIVVAPAAPAVARVEFLINGTEVAEDTSAPYAVPWTTPAGGSTRTFVARVIDTKGWVVNSAPMYLQIEPSALSVAITAPGSTATIGGATVPVTASPSVPAGWVAYGVNVYDPLEYASVSLTAVDAGNPNGPYEGDLDVTYLSNGWHILLPQVYAYNESLATYAEVTGSPIFVNVANAGPTVSLTAPANGAKVKQTVNLSASVTGGGTVYGVEFYAGDTYIDADYEAPFTVPWDTMAGSDGTVRVTALAYTTNGDARSAARFYSVRNLYAFMSAPTPNQTIGGTFLLKGGGRCDRDCALETATFFVDGVAVNYDRVAPYQFNLNTTAYSNGAHTYAITITTNDYRAVSSAIYPMMISN